MGNNCQTICKQPNAEIYNETSLSYSKLAQSIRVQEQFSLQFLPETVKQKISLLDLKIDPQNSEIWKYQEPRNNSQDQPYVIYTLVNKQNIVKSPSGQTVSDDLQINSMKVPQKRQNQPQSSIFNPSSFTQAAIFVFKSKPQSNFDVDSPQVPKQQLNFEQIYYGPVNDKMNTPNAIKIFRNGQHYHGNIQDNQLNGRGLIKNALGNHSYEGQWKNNIPHGQGVQFLDSKFKYEGSLKNGKWNGPGKLTLLNSPNPVKLVGNFVNGTLQGHGQVFDRLDQLIFDGEFKNGKEHGKGKWNGSNGSSYQGEFVEGRKQGKGIFTFISGAKYQGSFKNGQPDGEGVLIQDSIQTRGYWYKGKNVLTLKNQQ